jgi:hypothetical protein
VYPIHPVEFSDVTDCNAVRTSYTTMSRLIFSLSFCLLACAPHKEQAQVFSQSALPVLPLFAANTLWDDGLAEVATYSSTRSIYGAPRNFDYVMVTVKEDFNREYNVKTDSYSRSDVFTVLKVNLFARIPTDNYPYHFLTSMFFPRSQVAVLHKLTNSSQEWCGNTFKHVRRGVDTLRYTWDSYWDGEGVGVANLDTTAVFEDQLFLTLRALDFRDGLTATFLQYPSMITSRAAIAQPQTCTLKVASETLSATSTFMETECWRVSIVANNGSTLDYWYAKQPPHVLYRYASSDGRTMTLSSLRRAAYWQH